MSCTRSSPSCESRRRETASYSYRPCCALLVDLMCHSYSGRSSERAISSRELRLAGARLALDQQRPRQRDGGIHRHHQIVGGDVSIGAGKACMRPWSACRPPRRSPKGRASQPVLRGVRGRNGGRPQPGAPSPVETLHDSRARGDGRTGSAGQFEVALGFVARGDREALRGAKGAVLYPRHVVIARAAAGSACRAARESTAARATADGGCAPACSRPLVQLASAVQSFTQVVDGRVHAVQQERAPVAGARRRDAGGRSVTSRHPRPRIAPGRRGEYFAPRRRSR